MGSILIMTEFHFLRPNIFYLFIPFLLLVLLMLRGNRQTNLWQNICSKDLMPYILKTKSHRRRTPYIFTSFALSLLIFAAAGPAWNQISQPLIKSQSGLVIALDLSPTMNAEDIKPSRLQRAIYKISDLLDSRQEGQTALIVFSDEPFLVTPLTHDAATIKSLLPVLETKIMPSSGHQVNRAVSKSVELLAQAGINNGSILLVTSELANKDMEKAIEIATQHGTKISVLGVGTEESTLVPKQGGGFLQNADGSLVMTALAKKNLSQLAHATNGSYMTLKVDDSDIHQFNKEFSSLDTSSGQEQTEMIQNKWHDQGYLFVLLALPFAALIFRRGILLLVLFLMPYSLQAGLWDDLWRTPDQQAEQLYQEEKYQEARELFQNPDWQAASHYKLKEFDAASQLYQSNETVDGHYNYGTSRAKLGDYQEALSAYEKGLKIDPEHEDTLYNKKLIEDFLKQNQQDQQNSQDNKDQKQDKQNKDKNKDQNKDRDQQNQDQNKDQTQDQNQEQNQEQSDQQNGESKDQPEDRKEYPEKDEKKAEELKDQYRDQVEKEMQEEEKKEKKQPEKQAMEEEEPSEEDPQRQIDDRWLERVKDDPGGLLRRKFLQQYRQQQKAK